jgi:hypothetical protein
MAEGKANELIPRPLPLSSEAMQGWIAFVDHVERQIGRGGDLEPIRGLANKLPDHAARLAAVLTLVEDLNAGEVGVAFEGSVTPALAGPRGAIPVPCWNVRSQGCSGRAGGSARTSLPSQLLMRSESLKAYTGLRNSFQSYVLTSGGFASRQGGFLSSCSRNNKAI